jgi:hypothetical protein
MRRAKAGNEGTETAAPLASLAELLDCPEIEDAPSLGLLDHALELSDAEHLGVVEQRAGRPW